MHFEILIFSSQTRNQPLLWLGVGPQTDGDCLAAVSEVSYGLHGTLCCETLNQCAELVDKRDKYIRYIKSMYLVDFMFLTFHTLFSP